MYDIVVIYGHSFFATDIRSLQRTFVLCNGLPFFVTDIRGRHLFWWILTNTKLSYFFVKG